MAAKLNGVIPPMVTPFTEKEAVDYEGYAKNIERWLAAGVSAVATSGSNSEACALTNEERERLLKLAVDTVQGRVPIIVGTGAESTLETLRMTERAAGLGAGYALVLTPCYYLSSGSKREMIRFFSDVADASAIPVLIYNVPKFTNVNLPVEVVRELAGHPNICGMKDSAGNVTQLFNLKKAVPDDFILLAGTASMWLYALQMGIPGGVFALANCLPKQLARLQQLHEDGMAADAERLFEELIPLNTAVTASYGIPGLKYVCSKMGYVGGCVRRPLLELDEKQMLELDGSFSRYYE